MPLYRPQEHSDVPNAMVADSGAPVRGLCTWYTRFHTSSYSHLTIPSRVNHYHTVSYHVAPIVLGTLNPTPHPTLYVYDKVVAYSSGLSDSRAELHTMLQAID